MAISTAMSGMASASAMVEARVAVVTEKRPGCFAAPRPLVKLSPVMVRSIRGAREQAARAEHQHNQEGDVAGEDLPFGIDMRADGLRQADDNAAGERAPQAAQPADDHSFERVKEARRADA